MNRRFLFISILLVWVQFFCLGGVSWALVPSSDQVRRDSLETVLEGSEGHERATILMELFDLSSNQASDSARNTAWEILQIGNEEEEDTLKGWGHYLMAFNFYYRGEYDSATFHLKESLIYRRRSGAPKDLGHSLNVLGVIYDIVGETDSALAFYTEALDIQRQAGDLQGEISTLNNIAVLYQLRENMEEALNYYFQVLEADERLGDKKNISITQSNIATCYAAQEDYTKALKYHRKALGLRREIGNNMLIARSLNNIGNVYFRLEDYPYAEKYLLESIEMKRELENEFDLTRTLLNLSNVYISQEKFEPALEILEEAESTTRDGDLPKLLMRTTDQLAIVHAGLGEYKEAYEYDRYYRKLQDSLHLNEKDAQMQELLQQFKTIQQEMELDSLRFQKDLQDQQLDAAERQTNNLIGFSILVGLLAIGMFILFLQKRNVNRRLTVLNSKLGERNRQIKEKNKEIEEKSQLLERKNAEILEINQNLEKIVQERTKTLMETNEELDTFLYQTSHALRAPLLRIIGLFDLARNTDEVEVQQEMFGRIHETIERMDRMLFKLLEVQDVKLRDLKPEKLYVGPLIEETIEEVAQQSELARPELNIDYPSGLVWVPDRQLAKVVLKNLIENAWHFRRDGDDPHGVSINFEAGNGEARFMNLKVSDDGMGIPEAEQPLVFQMFHRSTHKSNGTGLGLYVIGKAVERMGGEVKLESGEGGPTTVQVRLPFDVHEGA